MSEALDTRRLRIEPISAKHISESWVSWLNDPEVTRFSDQRFRIHTLETCRAYVESFANGPDLLWAIIVKEGCRHVGNVAAAISPHHRTADLGILIGERAVWGRGIGLEAWSAVMRHLFDDCGIRKVTAGTLVCNEGMLSIMVRSGMTEEGRRYRQNLVDDREVDIVLFGAFADDWGGAAE